MLIHVCVHVCVLVCVAPPMVVGAWLMAGALRQLFILYIHTIIINMHTTTMHTIIRLELFIKGHIDEERATCQECWEHHRCPYQDNSAIVTGQ